MTDNKQNKLSLVVYRKPRRNTPVETLLKQLKHVNRRRIWRLKKEEV